MTTTAKGLTLTLPVKDGKLNPSERTKLTIAGYLQSLKGNLVTLQFSRPVTVRSNAQNRFLWGVVYELVAAETGHTPEEIHEVFKRMFLPREFVAIGGIEVEVVKSTKKLTPDEFSKYLEQIRAWSASELGFRIPLPNE